MRTVIFTSKNHILANAVIKQLFREKSIKITAIVESSIVYPGKSNLEALFFIIKKSGFYYTIFQVAKFIFFRIAKNIYELIPFKNENSILFPYQILASKKNIPVISTNNVNSDFFIKEMVKRKPDLFVSIFINQVFKSKLLSIPSKGTINMHPAYLPSYRGLSPTFWSLAHNKRKIGITIHEINDETIDTGKLLAQKTIPIEKSDTEYHLFWKCVLQGIPLLKEVIKNISKGRKISKKVNPHISQSYYSLPTKNAVKQFKKNGKKFITFSELFYSYQDLEN